MSQAITKKQKEDIFRDIDVTGKKFISQFKELAINAQKSMESKVQSAKFEAAYALSVNKEERLKSMSQIKEIRNETWEDALKMSNGDINAACDAYEKICSFP